CVPGCSRGLPSLRGSSPRSRRSRALSLRPGPALDVGAVTPAPPGKNALRRRPSPLRAGGGLTPNESSLGEIAVTPARVASTRGRAWSEPTASRHPCARGESAAAQYRPLSRRSVTPARVGSPLRDLRPQGSAIEVLQGMPEP